MRTERTVSKLDSLFCILQLSFVLHVSELVNAASYSTSRQPGQQYSSQQHPTAPHNIALDSISTLPVYWSKELDTEQSRLALFSYKDGQDFSAKVRSEVVVKLETGCGRPKNLLATLADGTRVCCRYRENQIRELRGDLYSYHLNGYLGLWNALLPLTFLKSKYSCVPVTTECPLGLVCYNNNIFVHQGYTQHLAVTVVQMINPVLSQTARRSVLM